MKWEDKLGFEPNEWKNLVCISKTILFEKARMERVVSPVGSVSKSLQLPELSQDKVWNLDSTPSPWLLCGWRLAKYISHYLLFPRRHTSRRLELEVELGTWTWDRGDPHSLPTTKPNAGPLTYILTWFVSLVVICYLSPLFSLLTHGVCVPCLPSAFSWLMVWCCDNLTF